ncbi:TPA: hypothetical protein RZK18_001864, partial [Campylobacter coli]|nr:hypothetical protein [Campylobacter coli]
MSNKEQIRKLRDNSELAWASYGYFHYFLEQQKKSYAVWLQDESGKNRLDENKKAITKSIDLNDVLDIEYKGLEVIKLDIFGNPEKIDTLKG